MASCSWFTCKSIQRLTVHRFFQFKRIFHLLVFSLLMLGGTVHARSECLTVFDVGSSGVRTGNSETQLRSRAPLEFLRTVWATGTLDPLLPDLVKILNDLPRQAHYKGSCLKLAGGFSAWRLALDKNPQALIAVLEKVQQDTGVYVVVIPQAVEGSYAWVGAQQRLGADLKTEYVLDVGGGSFQLSGQRESIGLPLGQKSNRRAVCLGLELDGGERCLLLPLSAEQRLGAKDLLLDRLKAAGQLSDATSIEATAVSRPVTRGVMPFANRVLQLGESNRVLTAQQVASVSEQLSQMDVKQVTQMMGGAEDMHEYLMSDLLLLEAVMQHARISRLHAHEADINNVPGLMQDQNLKLASQAYPCYLDWLSKVGIQAYALAGSHCLARSFWDDQSN